MLPNVSENHEPQTQGLSDTDAPGLTQISEISPQVSEVNHSDMTAVSKTSVAPLESSLHESQTLTATSPRPGPSEALQSEIGRAPSTEQSAVPGKSNPALAAKEMPHVTGYYVAICLAFAGVITVVLRLSYVEHRVIFSMYGDIFDSE
jgi:hypothetical protein